MASSSSSSFPSAFSSQPRKYPVFLSFRGEDTRKTFVGHFHKALEQQGIYTYKDDETLPRGESIGPSLKEAIEQSQIAVIVFSKNYANSSWCLDELVHIMECKVNRGLTVMPIFYDVAPSAIRKQKQEYGEAFAKHERESKNKVKSWRKALVDASNISGWETKHVANGHEAKVIEEIVGAISDRLQPQASTVNEGLVGIEARVQDLILKLQIGAGGVGMIGIWGVGGGGKTTLASCIYDEVSRKFDGCSFVNNIREEASRYGLEKLQEKILADVLKQKGMGGRWLTNKRLGHINVLLVLDDVDHIDHLRALAGSHDWFGEGSRIIITTRDQHLLNAHKVNVIHEISLFKDNEAIQLFCRRAFRHHKPKEGYEQLSKDVITYAGGLPLALTVIGCFLCDKDIKEWRSALARLKEIPDADIVEKLKISYDGLKTVEKELFLDIACFYRGRNKSEEIMATLDACGFYPDIGIKVLIQKALITISKYGKFEMHDLVQEMGHHIVRGEHPNNPEKHSRVWKVEDVIKICAMDATKELDMIKAIIIDWNWDLDDRVRGHLPSSVAKMKKLRWIDCSVDIPSPFPTNFQPVELCCLTLVNISLKRLWNGYKHFPNLKIMNLGFLYNLIMTPDFEGLPYLERFMLSDCRNLEEIHPSIGRLEKLVFLSVEGCGSLKMFPPITQLKELKTLSFIGCTNLGHLHLDNSGMRGYSNMGEYFIWIIVGCCSDTQVEKPREYFIDAECCLKEPCLPHMKGLQLFNTGLRKLNLENCNMGDEYFAVWSLPNLQELDLGGNNFSRLDFSLLQLPRLKWLNVSHCKKLVELSQLPSSIAVVLANFCTSLGSFGDISKCKWLWKVSLLGENKLGPLGQEILLRSMLQGNAIHEDHTISVAFGHQMVPEEFVGRMFRGKTCTLHLPHDWYTEYCGFLICIFTDRFKLNISIIIKHERDEDSGFEVLQERNEALESKYDDDVTVLGYVSFGSFRHPALSNSSYNMISFSIENMRWSFSAAESYVGAVLMPRKSKCHQVQTTDCSEFYDKEREDRNTFRVQHDSQSSIKILLRPYDN